MIRGARSRLDRHEGLSDTRAVKDISWLQFRGLGLVCLAALGLGPGVGAVAAETKTAPLEGLAVRLGGRAARVPFRPDAVEALLVAGSWRAPRAGEAVTMADGTQRVWEAVTAGEDGTFRHEALRGGYVYVPYVSETDQVLRLEARGHTMVYVNGEPRNGDPYQNGSAVVPVLMRRGTNDLVFSVARGALRVGFEAPAEPVGLDVRDTTLPDLVAGRRNATQGGVLVVNSTTEHIGGLALTVSSPGGRKTVSAVPPLLPLSSRKVCFRIEHSGKSASNQVELTLKLTGGRGARMAPPASAKVNLRLRRPDQTRRETFISEIDGSVQYFSVTPARPLAKGAPPLALVLSAHGAGVEAQGQADAYAPKTWAHVVAPTNRRAYGFDWEDWGRLDAMEVLAIAQSRLGTDPRQTYLTGHSMGGHGTWQLGATYPDRFAAIAPSAGWISFGSYGGGRTDEDSDGVARLLRRAAGSSDTLALASNYLHHAIYILHGDADDNVPVSEARAMRGVLEKFHRDFAYHEQPGAGHWWGNACVDWPPIFDMFARHKIPSDESLRTVCFTTANPGVSDASHWVSIEAQQRDLEPSSVEAHWDPGSRQFTAATTNVARLAFGVAHTAPGDPLAATLDGQKLTNLTVSPGAGRLWFSRAVDTGTWSPGGPPPASLKGPQRYGPFKDAFRHRMLFVYGTCGTPEENAWAFAKARFDAETFAYRGNGSVDVMPDTAFEPMRERDRSVILYGHAESNAAWPGLLGASPVQVRRGVVEIDDRELRGVDLACLFLRPRLDSDCASVGVVSGSGVAGMRLTDRVPYFVSGVALPDCTVWGPEALAGGVKGVRVAGFFGEDWSVGRGEFVWRDGR